MAAHDGPAGLPTDPETADSYESQIGVGINSCSICNEEVTRADQVKLTEKGCKSINSASKMRGDTIFVIPGDFVHKHCRKIYTHPHNVSACQNEIREGTLSPVKKKKCLRSENIKMDFSRQCLFCCQSKEVRRGHKFEKLIPVRTETFQESLKKDLDIRGEIDKWATEVAGRLAFAHDCCAYDVVYHNVCRVNFGSGYGIPQMFSDCTKSKKVGRPEDQKLTVAFCGVMEYIQCSDFDQATLPELVTIMQDILDENEANMPAYSTPYLKKKLTDHFGDEIIFTGLGRGKTEIVSLRQDASKILHDFFVSTKSASTQNQKKLLLKTAAQLLLNDIKVLSSETERDVYPDFGDEGCLENQINFLPESLKMFLKGVIKLKDSDLKVAAIGQAIVQASRPRTAMAPLQLGLGVQVHSMFSSKFLVETLNRLGFCVSYQEVQRYEVNAAAAQGTDIPASDETGKRVIHFVADNVDHDIATLDGHGTFHGMGIVAVVTPGKSDLMRISRKPVSTEKISQLGKIGFHFYRSEWNGLSSLVYTEVQEPCAEDETAEIDILWRISWPLKSPRPGWNGFMQASHSGVYPGKSAVFFMPMIDVNPGDMSCIFSTLHFVSAQAKKHGVTPVITFDQPLYWKAQTIVATEPPGSDIKNAIVLLGTFHMHMSFLGSIGHLMAGSGLQEVIEKVYAPNTALHILSGKAYSRAVRAHLLIDSALNTLVVSAAYDAPWLAVHQQDTTADVSEEPTEDEDAVEEDSGWSMISGSSGVELAEAVGHKDLDEATSVLGLLVDEKIGAREASKVAVLKRIQERLKRFELDRTSRTSQLWFMYMEMVRIIRQSIKAERTGNFSLHLLSVSQMLPFFASSGHNLYAKSGKLYLQQMVQLETTNQEVFNDFTSGHHVMRRSDRFWGGLSCDLIIEQTLMRSLKTDGGLTRGRGMGEQQRLVWLLSMPTCAAVNQWMQSLTQTSFATNEQHKEASQARQKRDHRDTNTIIQYLSQRNPFCADEGLRCIATGRLADASVNVDDAKCIGQSILANMNGQAASDVSFKRKNQAVTMATRAQVTIGQEPVQVDPQLLFQRLLIVAGNDTRLRDIFKHELTNLPTSLFDACGFPREANKHTLAEFLWSSEYSTSSLPSENVKYIIDGGSLIHRLPWPRGSSYGELAKMYLDFVTRKYSDAKIIFDGYCSGPGTKDVTHLRRSKGMTGTNIVFDTDMLLCDRKEHFLANSQNKQQFIQLLIDTFEAKGLTTCQARGDADCLIVQEALQSAEETTTVVIGEDTDLLVLLLHHVNPTMHDVYFKSGRGCKKNLVKIWDIKNVQAHVGKYVCQHILFSHAFCGCDTTSRIFGIAKSLPVKKTKNEPSFRLLAEVFLTVTSDHSAVAEAGEKIFVALYHGSEEDKLDNLRLVRYQQKLHTCSTQVQARALPPTSSAAQYHSFRVFYQVQEWASLGQETKLSPEDWGWELRQGQLIPVATNLPPAPEDMLMTIRCNCKTDCSSARCSCRKHGLVCTTACGECRGISCVNSAVLEMCDSDGEL